MLIQIKERRPAQLTVAAINAPCFRLQLVTNILISLHFTARGGRYLRIADFTVMLRVLLQQRFIRQETFWQPFGIIKTFHREDILHVLEFILKLRQFGRQRTGSLLGNLFRFNTDGIHFSVECLAPGRMGFTPFGHHSRFAGHRIKERKSVILGLEAQQIVVTQRIQQLFMRRQRGKNFRRRERNMQEKANPVIHSPFTQLSGEGQQVIIVDP